MIGRFFRKITEPRVSLTSAGQAMEAARRLSQPCIIQRVTEAATDETHVRATLAELLTILDNGFQVQVRLTALGLDFSIALVMEALFQLVERSGERTLWVEMESPDCHDVTNELVRRVRLRHSNIQIGDGGVRVVRYRPIS